MHAAILLAAAALGIDFGWQPSDGGGLEYLIQIEPELLNALRAGEAIRSDLPPALRDVRSYRITVGRGELPQSALPQAQPPAEQANPPPIEQPAGDLRRDGWTPTEARRSGPLLEGAPRAVPGLRLAHGDAQARVAGSAAVSPRAR